MSTPSDIPGQSIQIPHSFSSPDTLVQNGVSICMTLKDAGHIAYFAGGCVRDSLLDIACSDIDIATSAHPDEVQALFPKNLAVGKAFGVILVSTDIGPFEVATFRTDAPTGDGRRPDSVEFTDAQTDAQRRDFTINSLFYDPAAQIVLDYTGGIADLHAGLLRTVGNPADRFSEDYLRILRALRFTHTLSFRMDAETRAAIPPRVHHLDSLPMERIHQELNTLFERTQKPGSALHDLMDLGIWTQILQRSLIPATQPQDILIPLLDRLGPTPYSIVLSLYLKVSSLPAPTLPQLLTLGLSRKTAQECILLHQHLTPFSQLKAMDNYSLCKLAGLSIYPWIKKVTEQRIRDDERSDFEAWLHRAAALSPAPPPWITGKEIAEAKIPAGPQRTDILETAYKLQLNGEMKSRDELLNWLRQRAHSPDSSPTPNE